MNLNAEYVTKAWGLDFYRQRITRLYEEMKLGAGPDFSGRYLMNRVLVGVPLRKALEHCLYAMPDRGVLVVDFSGVEDLTGSVAEEVGPNLFTVVEEPRQKEQEKYLLYDGLTPDVRSELDAWFVKRGRCAPAFPTPSSDQHPLIGEVPPRGLLDVLEACYRQGPITSSDLSEDVKYPAKMLTDIHNQYPWLVHRQRISGETPRSWRYRFIPIRPPVAA